MFSEVFLLHYIRLPRQREAYQLKGWLFNFTAASEFCPDARYIF